MANIGGMICVDGKMPRVKPNLSRCCFCADKLTPGMTVKGLIDYDPTKPTALEQLNIYYAHAACLHHKMRIGGIEEIPAKPGAEWITDKHIKWFWISWGEAKGIGFEVRAMMPR